MLFDEKDILILELLKENAELTTSKISKKTRIPITTVHNRIKKLKENGIIKNFTLNINYEKIGKPLTAYVLITVNQNLFSGKKISQQDIAKRIKTLKDVETVEIVTGITDILIQVRSKTMRSLSSFITKELREIEGVDKTQTMMVLEEI